MSETENKKSILKKLAPIAGRIAFLLAIMFLIVYMITVLTSSGDFYKGSAERSALLNFEKELQKAEELADVHYQNLYEITEKLTGAESTDKIKDVLMGYWGSDRFGSLRYFCGGVLYDIGGAPVLDGSAGYDLILPMALSNVGTNTAIYYDKSVECDCIAFFAPVKGSSFIDGLVSIVPVRGIINAKDIINDGNIAGIVMDEKGKVYSSVTSSSFSTSVGENIYTFVSKFTNGEDARISLSQAVESKKKLASSIETIAGDYVFTMSPIEGFGGELMLVTMSESQGLIIPEMTYIRNIVNLIAIAVVSLIIGFVYAFFYYRETQKALIVANYHDPLTGCPNIEQFRSLASEYINDLSGKFSIAVIDIRQFHYISEQISEEEMTEFVKYIAKVIESLLGVRETYAYIGDGRFVLSFATSSEKAVGEKLRLLELLTDKNKLFAQARSKKKFNAGVTIPKNTKRYTIQELISQATLACENSKSNITLPYVCYTEQANEERDHNERIEAEMESALANGEFRLFLQPKYNVAADRIDSAEALVRWFDPKKGDYRFPGEFISLFESNGFITKLDHFMYLEALKALSTAAERGDKVVPISVNVSLVTASSNDFLDFYISNKKKFGIGDGFITVEFTESFAMGDYEKIYHIVKKLRENGIKISLDDFGTGYASFNILKNIPIDELKLDREFIKPGYSSENDEKLLESVISLAKSLDIRVVQEGVETKEMFDSVVEKGCDVIQGYYYAKAIPAEEYRLFIGSNTSIKFKSLVK